MFASSLSSILFSLLKIICWAIDRLTQLFEVFCGLTKVSYKGEPTFLFNIFLNHSTISNIYWGMALIGIALCFAFTIASVIRKMFDLNGRQQMSMGQILTEALKSFFIIVGMNLILSVAITGTDVLLRQVNYLFVNAEGLSRTAVVEFTDDQYAAMGRTLSTIANYGMNPSYNSRYNMNDCFNTIRPDLVYLEEQGVFDYSYPTEGGNTWQSVLQEVANSADLRYELKGDVYYESVTKALEHALEVMRSDASFRPLERFEEQRSVNASDVPLDRIVFLAGTLNAANNEFFNRSPSFTDALRFPYYTGEKSLYDSADYDSIEVISGDFNIDYSRFDYFVSFVLGIAVLYNTFSILLALVARMFNILFLYIIAPPVLAVRPLDGGGKTKQWVNAFIIQLLGVFGSIIVMRLLLIFVPMIYEPELVLISGNPSLNYFAKAVMLIAAYAVAKKAGGLLSGILSDTAAMQSMQAGDMSSTAQRAIGTARRVAGTALRSAGGVAAFAASPLTNVLKKPFDSYRRLGSGASSSDIRRQARERLAVEQMVNQMRGESDQGGGSDKGKGGPGEGNLPPQGGNGDLTKKQGDITNKQVNQQGRGTDFSRLKNALDIGVEGGRKRSTSVSRPQQNVPELERRPGGQPKAGEGLQRDNSKQKQPSDNLPEQQSDLPKQGSDNPKQKQSSDNLPKQGSGSVQQGGSGSLEQKQGTYSSELGSMRGSGRRDNESWAEDFQNMSYGDEEQDSFDVPSSLGGERISDFGESLQNDPLENLKKEMLSETLSEIGADVSGTEDFAEGSDRPYPQGGLRGRSGTVPGTQNQTRNTNGSGTDRRQNGNTQPPQQRVNTVPGTQNQSRNTNVSGTDRRQGGNTQPPQRVNTVPGTGTQPRSMNNTGTTQQQRGNTEPPQQRVNTMPGTQPQPRNTNVTGTTQQQRGNTEPPQQRVTTAPGTQPQPRSMNDTRTTQQQRGNTETQQQRANTVPDTQPQPRSMNDTRTTQQQRGNTEPPQQRVNTVPGTQTQPRNTNVTGPTQQQRGNTEPPQQRVNTVPGTQTRPGNTVTEDLPRQTDIPGREEQQGGPNRVISVREYMRQTYRELNRDSDEQNTGT